MHPHTIPPPNGTSLARRLREARARLAGLSPDVAALNPDLLERLKVRARPEAAAGPRFKSRLEARAWSDWVPAQGAALAWYEPFVLHLDGGNYTPDFVLVFPDGALWLVEVKGSWQAHPSGRSSKRNLRQAAAEFAALGRWFALLPDGRRGWKLTEVAP